MKKAMFFAAMAIVGLLFASCNKNDYKSFVGTWGVEKIVYESYNTDWQGSPIQGSMETETYTYNPEELDKGIQLVFREDKTGEMRDNDVDTVWYDWNEETHVYDSYVVNPDTTLVTRFTYSYDQDESVLYMNLPELARTYMMQISDLTSNSFTYKNNYDIAEDNRKYIETAYMKRISGNTSKSAAKGSGNGKCHPRLKGSLFGD